ncbi:Ig domain protein group 2 domain protein [Paenibacillus sediminis]|uniref:Uncharacterized protein n=1 Tax=Paenibacillus sediminis TaxID=664909 RepID=A0ABS4H4Z5_9BACL|nr:Ig domain protein group 2 domain protein [Paenibacillus sediminis]MBP1937536.1 hypothetical protein [Paenibacillus sediminis]
MKRNRINFLGRLSILFLAIIIIIQSFPAFVPVAKAGAITPLKYYQEANYRYFVGLMYFDMWKNTAGVWVTDGGKQPNKGMHGDATFTYNFRFPGRKIKSIDASIYVHSQANDIYFSESRSESYSDYQGAISTGTNDSNITNLSKQGIGTDTSTIDITVNALLDAATPEDIKDTCSNCAAGVEAYRIYWPVLFKIELATRLNVKYFTTDGQPLTIFPAITDQEMTVGKLYDFVPPADANYDYVGFKKSTTGSPPSGSIISGDEKIVENLNALCGKGFQHFVNYCLFQHCRLNAKWVQNQNKKSDDFLVVSIIF